MDDLVKYRLDAATEKLKSSKILLDNPLLHLLHLFHGILRGEEKGHTHLLKNGRRKTARRKAERQRGSKCPPPSGQ